MVVRGTRGHMYQLVIWRSILDTAGITAVQCENPVTEVGSLLGSMKRAQWRRLTWQTGSTRVMAWGTYGEGGISGSIFVFALSIALSVQGSACSR